MVLRLYSAIHVWCWNNGNLFSILIWHFINTRMIFRYFQLQYRKKYIFPIFPILKQAENDCDNIFNVFTFWHYLYQWILCQCLLSFYGFFLNLMILMFLQISSYLDMNYLWINIFLIFYLYWFLILPGLVCYQ